MSARGAAAVAPVLLFAALGGAAGDSWDLRLAPERVAATTVTVENRCATSHRFSLSTEPAAGWLRLADPGAEHEVGPAASAVVEAAVDTRGIEPGLYETVVTVECVTCGEDPACRQDRDLLTARLQVPWTEADLAGFERDEVAAPGELLVLLPPLDPRDLRGTLRDFERDMGLRILRSFPLASLDRHLVILGTREASPAAILGRLQQRPEVTWTQPSFRYRTLDTESPGDPLADVQYAARMIRAFEVHGRSTGRGVRVAIIDSGVAEDHPDLAGRLALARTFLPGARKPTPHRHGTAVAGLIGAGRSDGVGIAGVAPGAELIALEACAGAGEGAAACTSESVARALDAALGAGARVINLSVGGPRDPLIARLAREAARRRALLVAAAGNDGSAGAVAHPAALPEVVAVTAVDAEERPYIGAVRGPEIELAAPGVEALAPVPGGFHPMTGTSMAAAHVSALAALALEADPGLGPGELREHLGASARDLGAPGRDPVFGRGLVDACALLARIAAEKVCGPD